MSILLLDLSPGKPAPKEGERNLLAVNKHDRILLIAELPSKLYDTYFRIKYDEEKDCLLAWSSHSYLAEIDLKSGRLISKVVTW